MVYLVSGPTASKQGLRPCTPAPAASFRLRRAMLDSACGVLPEAARRARRKEVYFNTWRFSPDV